MVVILAILFALGGTVERMSAPRCDWSPLLEQDRAYCAAHGQLGEAR